MSTIGSRIRSRREELGLSQDELSRRLGYKSRSSINKIELDQRNLTQSKIKAIADTLETTPSYIMGWDESEQQFSTIDRIKEIMKQRGINAKTLTEKCQLPASAITEWSKGKAKPSTESIVKIAQYFNVSTDYLLGVTTEKTPFVEDEERSKILNSVISDLSDLPENLQKQALDYVRFLKSQYDHKSE